MQSTKVAGVDRYGKGKPRVSAEILAVVSGMSVFLTSMLDLWFMGTFLDGLKITVVIALEACFSAAFATALYLAVKYASTAVSLFTWSILTVVLYGALPGLMVTVIYSSYEDAISTLILSVLSTYVGSLSGVVAIAATIVFLVFAYGQLGGFSKAHS